MRTLLFCVAFAGFTSLTHAQSTSDILKQQAGQGVKDGATVVTQKAGEKVTDKVLSKIFDKKKKKDTDSPTNNSTTSNSTGTTEGNSKKDNSDASQGFKTYSKFDFIPGDKVLAYDDFSKDAIGDFPVIWNTNSSGEVVTASGQQGHWLMVRKQGKYVPEYIKTLPDNFTFEYDVVCNEKYSYYSPYLQLYFLSGNNSGKEVFDGSFVALEKRSGVKIGIHPTNAAANGGNALAESFEDGTSVIKNKINTTQFNSSPATPQVHFSNLFIEDLERLANLFAV